MRPYRSMLFVPGHKPSWVDKGVAAGAHALILDLEDSVPEPAKAEARTHVAASIDRLAASDAGVGVVVRVNALDDPAHAHDVPAVVRPGLDALLLPKLYGRDDVVRFDALVTAAEIVAGMPPGGVRLVASLETAKALLDCADIASASPRVGALMTAAARDSDVSREVGFSWTPEGLETLHFRGHSVLAARAAGLRHVVCGLWQELGDLDGLRAFAGANQRLGFTGQVVIHPSHVPVVNEVYAPSPDTVARYRRLVAAYDAAVEAGAGAASFEGEHVDLAHARHAREVLALADEQDPT